jgi:hypothetical protein
LALSVALESPIIELDRSTALLNKRSWWLVAVAFAAGMACGSEDTTPVNRPNACVDRDGDGYGIGCTLGLDCDDNDPAVTTECQDGGTGATGGGGFGGAPVACTEGQTASCKLYIDAGAFTRCYDGERTCENGEWGACIPLDGGGTAGAGGAG